MVIDNNERSNRGGADFEKIKQQTAERAWPIDPFGDSCFPPKHHDESSGDHRSVSGDEPLRRQPEPMTKQSRSEACGAFVARDVQ